MTLSRNTLIFLAAAGSAAVLLGAFGFQYLGALAPCKLCLWQRWPHAAAVLIGALALATRSAALPLLGALSALATGAIGVYHTGVERAWWPGPDSCTASGPITGLSPDELLAQIMTSEIQRCDEVVWDLFGLSMASWNALASAAFAALWIAAALKTRNKPA
ncbi:disulfide bond formation protein B [Salipiger sp. P9]|uniref:disulfide bond formation protein B n=1 Tax=Salipiger pentaromativorans TaxID=2943193 RepID=UPI00215802BC|nr:disulfide bond formation protein B [Salipiger pentaromativorans]MCR8549674.1 disulfide bond formation protein B [Salipiger pentaromativorans]